MVNNVWVIEFPKSNLYLIRRHWCNHVGVKCGNVGRNTNGIMLFGSKWLSIESVITANSFDWQCSYFFNDYNWNNQINVMQISKIVNKA